MVRARRSSCNILVKARQGGIEPARKPKRAKDKEAFGVGQVVHDIANAPFPGRVTIQRAVPRDAAEQREGVGQLTLENLANVASGYLIDVGEIVLRRFGAIWNGDHVTRFPCVASEDFAQYSGHVEQDRRHGEELQKYAFRLSS